MTGEPASEPRVAVFFYGSYINRDVLRDVGLVPDEIEVAKLSGFEIRIRPLANLDHAPAGIVWGILTRVTHAELERLYAHARDVLGGVYLPQAVLVETLEQELKPALCYIAPSLEERPATGDYIDRIVGPAMEYGFPVSYIERLESFRVRS
jgi:hypothetical protein